MVITVVVFIYRDELTINGGEPQPWILVSNPRSSHFHVRHRRLNLIPSPFHLHLIVTNHNIMGLLIFYLCVQMLHLDFPLFSSQPFIKEFINVIEEMVIECGGESCMSRVVPFSWIASLVLETCYIYIENITFLYFSKVDRTSSKIYFYYV
jgi:hypothetical protein